MNYMKMVKADVMQCTFLGSVNYSNYDEMPLLKTSEVLFYIVLYMQFV